VSAGGDGGCVVIAESAREAELFADGTGGGVIDAGEAAVADGVDVFAGD
jgi:hypothetical protein